MADSPADGSTSPKAGKAARRNVEATKVKDEDDEAADNVEQTTKKSPSKRIGIRVTTATHSTRIGSDAHSYCGCLPVIAIGSSP